MGKQSAFDQNAIEVQATPPTEDLLDQLNLPPAVADFMRRNRRAIWAVVGVVVLLVVGVALFDSYRTYRISKAVEALDAAMVATNGEREQQLRQVIEQYASTPSALWARIELARLRQDKGDIKGAVAILEKVNSELSSDDPAKPLVLFNLGGLYEQEKKLDQALVTYRLLSSIKGFEAEAFKAMGRVYEQQQNQEGAAEMYRKYLALTGKDGETRVPDPERNMIEARLNRLQS